MGLVSLFGTAYNLRDLRPFKITEQHNKKCLNDNMFMFDVFSVCHSLRQSRTSAKKKICGPKPSKICHTKIYSKWQKLFDV